MPGFSVWLSSVKFTLACWSVEMLQLASKTNISTDKRFKAFSDSDPVNTVIILHLVAMLECPHTFSYNLEAKYGPKTYK